MAGPAGLQAAIAAAQPRPRRRPSTSAATQPGGQVRIAASVPSRAEFGDIVRNPVQPCRADGRRHAATAPGRSRAAVLAEHPDAVVSPPGPSRPVPYWAPRRRGRDRRRARRPRGARPARRGMSSSSTSWASTRRRRWPSCSPIAAARSRSSRRAWSSVRISGSRSISSTGTSGPPRRASRNALISCRWAGRPGTLDAAAPSHRRERRGRRATGSCSRCRNSRSRALPRAAQRAAGLEVHRVGDCVAPRRAHSRRDRGRAGRSGAVIAVDARGRRRPRRRAAGRRRRVRGRGARPRRALRFRHGSGGQAARGRDRDQRARRLGPFAPGRLGAARSARRSRASDWSLLPASADGRDLAPRLAHALRRAAARRRHRGRRAPRHARAAAGGLLAETHIDRARGRHARARCPRVRAECGTPERRPDRHHGRAGPTTPSSSSSLPPDPATVDLAEARAHRRRRRRTRRTGAVRGPATRRRRARRLVRRQPRGGRRGLGPAAPGSSGRPAWPSILTCTSPSASPARCST